MRPFIAVQLLCTLVLLSVSDVRSGAEGNVAAGTILDARRAFAERKWEEAATLYGALADDNPYQGRFAYRLASALYNLKQYEASAEAYERAAALGYRTGTSLYNMGCNFALLGDAERAVDAIERAIRNGLRRREQLIREDTDLDAIRDTPLFHARILPATHDDTPRDQRWRVDLDYLTRRMEETHWNVYANITKDEWLTAIEEIVSDAPHKAEHEIVVDLMALVARVGDGHTRVEMPTGTDGWHAIPARFYIFKDGVFVRSAAEASASAVGKRVLRIGKLPVDEALARTASVTQRDNDMQIKWISPRFLSIVEILDGLDIIDGLGSVDVVLEADSGSESVRFEPVRLAPGVRPDDIAGAVRMNADALAPLPLWLKNHERHYWFEYLADEKLVYFQYNAVVNQEGETIAEFSDRLFGFIDNNDVDALVIDVRLNHGGNNFLNLPVIQGIVRSDKINELGRLFVITGRETFSACQNFVNRLQRQANVVFVGEPTASRPNFVGEGNPIVLPYSELVVNGSSRYWQDSVSEDQRPWIAPDLVAELTSSDFRQNRDPAMAAIRAFIESRDTRKDDRASK